MGIDSETFQRPTMQGDVAAVALQTTIAISFLRMAIQEVADRTGVDVSDLLDPVSKCENQLAELFEELAGWVDDA